MGKKGDVYCALRPRKRVKENWGREKGGWERETQKLSPLAQFSGRLFLFLFSLPPRL